MNKLDKLLIDDKLKQYYEDNHKKQEELKLNKELYIRLVPSYQWITPIDNIAVTSINIDQIKKTKSKLDLKLINTLTNLVNMYKLTNSIEILKQIELVLEEYIDNQQDRF